MISPTDKLPGEKLNQIALLEQAAANLHYKSLQLQRTLWLAAKQAGGTLILDEQKVDLLWNLAFERTPEGMLKVVGAVTPEADEADIELAAKALLGTNGQLTVYAADHERLKNYPIEYLEYRMSKHCRYDGTMWVTIEQFTESSKHREPPPAPPTQ
jgi:hypothetical protein